jgi:3-deoxy-D-manno-octulosonic acid kinase
MQAAASPAVLNAGIGRAKVTRFILDQRPLVLKHYLRGGAIAALSKDRYLGWNVEHSRSFREWRLLHDLHARGLPVPRPVAAHTQKAIISYRADLITEEIPDALTLADVLGHRTLAAAQWQKIGACIHRFHQHNVYHADLNARNILLAGTTPGEETVYLIDFDRGRIRRASVSWKLANLARMLRSLQKFQKNTPGFHFTNNDWDHLLQGYNEKPDQTL